MTGKSNKFGLPKKAKYDEHMHFQNVINISGISTTLEYPARALRGCQLLPPWCNNGVLKKLGQLTYALALQSNRRRAVNNALHSQPIRPLTAISVMASVHVGGGREAEIGNSIFTLYRHAGKGEG